MLSKRVLLSLLVVLILLPTLPQAAENSGLFLPPAIFAVSARSEALAIGDVNGDGRDDVVVVTRWAANLEDDDMAIYVFLQDSSGVLQPPMRYSGGNGSSVGIADLNNDGRADVVVTAQDGIGVFLQNSGGTLAPEVIYQSNHSSFTNSYKLATGDFNNDGRKDVAAIDWGTQSNDVDVFLQSDNGTLDPALAYQVTHTGYDDIDVGDLDSDGLQDLVVMSGQSSSSQIGIIFQTSGGTFSAPVYYDLGVSEMTRGVAVGDVNDDGLDDVVVTYGGDEPKSQIARCLQTSTGTLVQAVAYPSGGCPFAVEVGDINFDAKKDIVVLMRCANGVGVSLQRPDGSVLPQALYPFEDIQGWNPHAMRVGDLNGDGWDDVALVEPQFGLVVYYHSPPIPGTIGTETTITNATLGGSKPTVYVEYETQDGQIKKQKAAILERSAESARIRWNSALPPASYTLLLQTKGGSPTSVGVLQLREPEIDEISSSSGRPGETVLLQATLLGSSKAKPKVFFEFVDGGGQLQRISCKIVKGTRTWNPEPGLGSLVFRVPKTGPVTGLANLTNKIGESTAGVPFTITQ
jgi:hypothetical protein